MRAAILCLFLLGAFVGASSSTAGNADAAAGDVPADVPELKDSYTSIFVPCRLTFYGDGSGAGGREGGGPERLLAHSNYGSPFCGEELQVLSVDDRHIMFWPDALVGDAIVCYGASAVPKLEEELPKEVALALPPGASAWPLARFAESEVAATPGSA